MFLRINHKLIPAARIREVDITNIEDLRLNIYLEDGPDVLRIESVQGIQAIELLMALRPSVLESRRLRWARHAWAFHNLVGHPLMQLLAFFKKYKLAMQVHDSTVPRPLGRK